MADSERAVLLGALCVLLVGFVGAPVAIAFARKHPERRTILQLSPLSLFSFILWGALIAWAASDTRNEGVIARYVAMIRGRRLLPLIVAALVLVGAVGSAAALLR